MPASLMEHERMRWGYMNTHSLQGRLRKMRQTDKLMCYLRMCEEKWTDSWQNGRYLCQRVRMHAEELGNSRVARECERLLGRDFSEAERDAERIREEARQRDEQRRAREELERREREAREQQQRQEQLDGAKIRVGQLMARVMKKFNDHQRSVGVGVLPSDDHTVLRVRCGKCSEHVVAVLVPPTEEIIEMMDRAHSIYERCAAHFSTCAPEPVKRVRVIRMR